MGKAARLREVRRKKQGIPGKLDPRLYDALVGLRHHVENLNKSPCIDLKGEVFQETNPNQVFTTTVDGVEFGYKLEDYGLFMLRKVYVVFKGYDIEEIPKEQKDPIMLAVFEAMLDKGEAVPDIRRTAKDCVLVTQQFIPITLVEKNPNLVSISNMPSGN